MKLNLVPAKAGVLWVRQGIRTFWKRPLAMTGLFFMFMTCMSVLSVVPLLGDMLALMLIPAGTLGLMAASREIEAGKFPMPLVLLTGFRGSTEGKRKLLILGGLYAFGFVGVMGLSALADGGDLAKLYLIGGSLDMQTLAESDFRNALWVALFFYIPLTLIFWHAPALSHWYGVPVVKSLFFSTVACLSNWRAFMVFGLAWSVIVSTAVVLIVFIADAMDDSGFAALAVLPTMLLLMAMFFCSLYNSFQDCFSSDAPST